MLFRSIGGSEEVSILDLVERVKRAAKSSSPILQVPYADAYPEGGYEDMRRRVPCICRIEALTGWRPSMNVDEIIRRTVAYERQKRDATWFEKQSASSPSPMEVEHSRF